MPESSPNSLARGSNLSSLILRKVAGVKSVTVATALDHSPDHISRILSCERGLKLNEMQTFFDVLGLSVIESSGQIVQMSAEKAQALRTLAMESLARDGA